MIQIPVPIYNKHHEIIQVVEHSKNLNIQGPSYINEGGNMGLIRITEGKYKGCLAILYQYPLHPSCNRGELISDHDAWEICQNRGKISLIHSLNIEWNRGIMEE